MKRNAALLTLAGLTIVTVVGTSAPAMAQMEEEASTPDAKLVPAQPSLRDRLGVAPLERALRQTDARKRERALLRLGELGTPRALEILVRALEPSGNAQSARERLIAVRALAPHVKREAEVRECLVRVMTGISTTAERAEPLHAMLRDTAALALSGSGDRAALEALGKALRQPGRVAQAAGMALVAHPPRELGAILLSHRAPTLELVAVLEQLGDQRAFEVLRDVVRRGGPELAARAAVALTRLGNFETVAVAQRWMQADGRPALLLASAEILSLSHDPAAAPLLERLLREPATRDAAFELGLQWSPVDLTQPALAEVAGRDPQRTRAWIAALGRSGTRAAVGRLGELLKNRTWGVAAAYALALSDSRWARGELARALGDARTRRLAARASALVFARSAQRVDGLRAALEALQRGDAADRAVSHYGVALLEPERLPGMLRSDDALVLQAAARVAPFGEAAPLAAARLASVPAGASRTQLALALVDEGARASVPNRVLLELLVEAGPAAPLALFALGERDAPELRARLLEQASSPDPWRRAHVALGLGSSSDPTAVSVLESSYLFEVDATVRSAIIAALSRRPERVTRRTLELAAKLDPAGEVRHTAELALRGVRARPFAAGPGALCIELEPTAAALGAAILAPGGLALPVLADPDGVVTLTGLPAGPVGLRLALVGPTGKAPPAERRQ